MQYNKKAITLILGAIVVFVIAIFFNAFPPKQQSIPTTQPSPSKEPTTPTPIPTNTPMPTKISSETPTRIPTTISTQRTFKPPQCSDRVNQAIIRAANLYNLPRWFYYALVLRESYCDPNAKNSNNNGLGLTQLTGEKHNGMPYPMNLQKCDPSHQQWIWDMGINIYGKWVNMCNVTFMSNPYDPDQNLSRFSTAHVVPWFLFQKNKHPQEDNVTLLERVAFNWYRGYFKEDYPNDDRGYLDLYRKYVNDVKPKTEAEDGVWDGNPR